MARHGARLVALAGALLAGACKDRVPERLSDCPDIACTEAWFIARKDEDPAVLVQAVREVQDPVRHTVAVEGLLASRTQDAEHICTLFEGEDRFVCQRVVERPHLRQGNAQVAPSNPPPVVALLPPSPWSGLQPLDARCEDGASGDTCRVHLALKSAGDDPERAARYCLGIAEEKWRDECFFLASENSYGEFDARAVEGSARLCLGAGQFAPPCFTHLEARAMKVLMDGFGPRTQIRGEPVPGSSAWWQLHRSVSGLHAALAPHPALERYVVHRLLARTTWDAARLEGAWAALLVDPPDPAFVRHLRARAAWLGWQAEEQEIRSLTEWARRVEDHLPALSQGDTSQDLPLPETQGWSQPIAGEEDLPAMGYLSGPGLRTWSPDPLVDAAICVMEAAARQGGTRRTRILRDGLEHPDASVRWTTARLMSEFALPIPGDVNPKRERDARVRQRYPTALQQTPLPVR